MSDGKFSPYIVLLKDGDVYGVVMSDSGSPIMSLKEAREAVRPCFEFPDTKYRIVSIEQMFEKVP